MKLIGHRFLASHNPENSISGLNFSLENNLWAVETDVQMTKDGKIIILHDKLLDRTTNQTGYAADWTIKDLNMACKLSNNEPIPTLEDVLKRIKYSDTKIYVEVIDPTALDETQKIINKFSLSHKVVISSFHHEILVRAKKEDISQRTMALFECNPLNPVDFVKATLSEEVGVGFESISKALIQSLEKVRIETFAWTVNNRLDYEKSKLLGLSGVFTDNLNIVG